VARAASGLVRRYVPGSRPGVDPVRSQTVALLARTMLASYRSLIQTPRFVAYALTAAGAHAGFHIFAAGAPAVLIIGLAIAPQDYGYYASLPPMGFLVGSFLSNRLPRRFGARQSYRPRERRPDSRRLRVG